MRFETWEQLVDSLHQYCRRSLDRRRQFIFRGQRDSNWQLLTTLDRGRSYESDLERERVFADLLRVFRRELLHLEGDEDWRLRGDALELMARHHGLPTPMLDWTESPFVAAFFAFSESLHSLPNDVTIWCIDRAKLPDPSDFVTIIDDGELLPRNRRAIRQRAVFLRVRTARQPLEEMLGDALFRMDLPSSQAEIALAALDEMTITATTLFNDMDAAARTATQRVIGR